MTVRKAAIWAVHEIRNVVIPLEHRLDKLSMADDIREQFAHATQRLHDAAKLLADALDNDVVRKIAKLGPELSELFEQAAED